MLKRMTLLVSITLLLFGGNGALADWAADCAGPPLISAEADWGVQAGTNAEVIITVISCPEAFLTVIEQQFNGGDWEPIQQINGQTPYTKKIYVPMGDYEFRAYSTWISGWGWQQGGPEPSTTTSEPAYADHVLKIRETPGPVVGIDIDSEVVLKSPGNTFRIFWSEPTSGFVNGYYISHNGDGFSTGLVKELTIDTGTLSVEDHTYLVHACYYYSCGPGQEITVAVNAAPLIDTDTGNTSLSLYSGAVLENPASETFKVRATDDDSRPMANVVYTVTGPENAGTFPYVKTDSDNYTHVFTSTTAGTYTIGVVATDLAGETDQVGPVTFTVDSVGTKKPSAWLTSTAKRVVYEGVTVGIGGNGTDSDGLVSWLEFYYKEASEEDSAYKLFAREPTSGDRVSESVLWPEDGESVSPNTYQLVVLAEDNEGARSGYSTPQTIIVVPPLTPPTITLITPMGNETYQVGQTVPLVAEITDPGSNVTSVQFSIVNSDDIAYHDVTGTGTANVFTYEWAAELGEDVRINAFVYFDIFDSVGNFVQGSVQFASAGYVNVTANAPPHVTITHPDEEHVDYREGSPVLLKFNATDSDGTVQTVEVFSGGASIGFATPSTEVVDEFEITDWVPGSIGEHFLTVEATDNAGGSNPAIYPDNILRIINVVEMQAPTAPPASVTVDGIASSMVNLGKSFYTLEWSSSGDADFYELYENGDNLSVPEGHVTYLVTGKPNGDYKYEVKSCNAKGCSSEFSTPITAKVLLPVPATPLDFADPKPVANAGNYTLNWPPSSGFPVPSTYKLEEKPGASDSNADWEEITLGSNLSLSHTFSDREVGKYSYQLSACDDNGCSLPGPLWTVEVLPPIYTQAELACEDECLIVAGDYIVENPATTVTLTAIHDSTITTPYSNTGIVWTGAGQFQLNLQPGSPLHAAFSELGVRVTVTNPNGASAHTIVYADAANSYINLSAAAPTIGEDGTIYVASGDNLHALDPSTFEEVGAPWPYSTSGAIRSTPVINEAGDTVYVGSKDDKLHAVSTVSGGNLGGERKWYVLTGDDVIGSAVLEPERDGEEPVLYFGSMDGTLYAIHTVNGGIKWEYPAGSGIADTPILSGDGTIYVTTVDGHVHAVRRGALGPDVLVWESVDDSILAYELNANDEWMPGENQVSYLLQVSRLFHGLLSPPLNLNREILSFWTYALVNKASIEEVAAAFLYSDTGKGNFPPDQNNVQFLDALYERFFAGFSQFDITHRDIRYSYADFLTLLESGETREAVVVRFANSVEYSSAVDNFLYQAFPYFYEFDQFCTGHDYVCMMNDPTAPSDDGDTVPDWWEEYFFGSASLYDDESDPDGDGVSNLEAFNSGADPCRSLCTDTSPVPVPFVKDPPALDLSSERIGATAGNFRVNESGSATYSVPIFAPAGIAGVTPQISLNYDSQGGNGLLGKGWSIGGLSAISRCRQTLSQDANTTKAISWTDEDRFCLDGQRLVRDNASDTYGAVGIRYRTEIDSYAVITSKGGDPGHPDYFTVERKDGSVSEYGNNDEETSSQRKNDNGQVLTWAINQFADSIGQGLATPSPVNTIIFIYANDIFGQRITQIDYADEKASVQFDYDEGMRDDILKGYVAGHLFTTDALLRSITVYNDSGFENGEVRRYELDYNDTSGEEKNSHLQTITECASSGADSACLAPTTFSWAGPNESGGYSYTLNGRSVTAADSPGFGYENQGADFTLSTQQDRVAIHRLADINGDGQMDVVWLEPDWDMDGKIHDHYLRYALSDGESLVPVADPGYSDTYNTDTPFKIEVLDYNADGRHDVAIYDYRQWQIFLAQPVGNGWRLPSTPINTPVDITSKNARFIDINGDGLVDAIDDDNYYLLTEGNEGDRSTDQYYRFSAGEPLVWEGTDEVFTERYFLPGAGDFDGDGTVDLIAVEVQSTWGQSEGKFSSAYIESQVIKTYAMRQQDGYFEVYEALDEFTQECDVHHSECISEDKFRELEFDRSIQPVDINGDGLSDLVLRVQHEDELENVDGDDYTYRLNTGNGFAQEQVIGRFPLNAQPQFVDHNLDGHLDIIWHDVAAQQLKLRLWDPRKEILDQTVTSVVSYTGGVPNDSHIFVDMNGDAALDYVHFGNQTLTTYPSLSANQPRHVITEIDNGMDVITTVTYGALTTSGHYQRMDVTLTATLPEFCNNYPALSIAENWCLQFVEYDSDSFYGALNADWQMFNDDNHTLGKVDPVLELMAPLFVVTDVASTAPATPDTSTGLDRVAADATSGISYFYNEAKIAASGRGLLGFKTVRTVDQQTGIDTTTTYRQDFPFIGYPLMTEVKTGGGKLLSRATNTWQLHGGTAAPAPYKPFIRTSVEESYDFNSASLLSTVTTANLYDAHGNATDITVDTTDASTLETYTQHTANIYNDAGLDAEYSQEKGRLTKTTVTFTRPEMLDITRVSTFDYIDDGSTKGLLWSETVMKDETDTNPLLVTTYEYDDRGNKTKVLVTGDRGDGPQLRTSEWEYDDDGRYIAASFNANDNLIGRTTWRNILGQATESNDNLGNVVKMRYGLFGREYFRGSNSGGYSHSVVHDGIDTLICPTGTRYHVTTEVAGVATDEAGSGNTITCFDVLSREIASAKVGFSSLEWVVVDTQYDSLGRIKHKTAPYKRGEYVPFSSMAYDDLGRIIALTYPDKTTSETDYDGYTVTSTNAMDQTKTQVSNALGELLLVTDAMEGTVEYGYDATGNLKTTTTSGPDAAPGVDDSIVVKMYYDNNGRKTGMDDPDKGHWEYDYNDFGELIEQRDANGQKTVMKYDKMGRMYNREDYSDSITVQATTDWEFYSLTDLLETVTHSSTLNSDTSSYNKDIYYDGFGRFSTSTTTINNVDYIESVTYDQFGRVFQRFDASGTERGTESSYNNRGYLSGLREAMIINGGQITYVQYQEMDARGNVTQEMLGNGLTTTRYHNPNTGRLESIFTSLGGLPAIQELAMGYDDLGNLDNRMNVPQGRVEHYCYDDLNRLTAATVDSYCFGGEHFDYDSYGNITRKEGVGSDYTYGAGNAGPHAMTSVGGIHYRYDDNGNMTSDDTGRNLAYTAFDKPYQISKGSHTTAFRYGPGRSRYRRVDTDTGTETTTHYIGNVEFMDKDGVKTIKRYIAGKVIVNETHDGDNKLLTWSSKFLLKDHLGSVDVITGQNAGMSGNVERASFDPWGQRRNATDLTTLLTSFEWGPLRDLTTRGFTGHEMLDEVGLVHMNGRIYDPKLGRFMQADPQVQFPSDTQSYNRYSYAHNNPLKYTDSTGYGLDVFDAIKIIGTVVLAVVPGGQAFIPAWVGFWSGAQTAYYGGSIGQIATSAFTSAAMAYVGTEFAAGGFSPGELVGFSALGGITSELNGGKFGHGFVSAGVGAYVGASKLGGVGGTTSQIVGRTLAKSVIGGTISKLTGGKFANGAVTAAFTSVASEGAQQYYANRAYPGESYTEFMYRTRGIEVIAQQTSSGAAPVWPTNHLKVTSGYSLNRVDPVTGKTSRPHTAIDIKNPQSDPVYSILDGTVSDVGSASGAGDYIKVDHANGLQTSYSHTGSSVSIGDSVSQGQIIGTSNSSGRIHGPHLHFVTRQNGVRVNPCSVVSCPP